jgi:hypothetical protein
MPQRVKQTATQLGGGLLLGGSFVAGPVWFLSEFRGKFLS